MEQLKAALTDISKNVICGNFICYQPIIWHSLMDFAGPSEQIQGRDDTFGGSNGLAEHKVRPLASLSEFLGEVLNDS